MDRIIENNRSSIVARLSTSIRVYRSNRSFPFWTDRALCCSPSKSSSFALPQRESNGVEVLQNEIILEQEIYLWRYRFPFFVNSAHMRAINVRNISTSRINYSISENKSTFVTCYLINSSGKFLVRSITLARIFK